MSTIEAQKSNKSSAVLGRPALTRLALVLAVFVNNANFSATTVALPSIQRSFDLGFSGLQWAVTSYLVTYAGFMLLGGSLADVFGIRRVLVAGVSLYFAALVVVVIAPSAPVLFTGRALQGVAAAMVTPTATAAARRRFTGAEQTATIGLVVGMSAIAQAVGPPLGGLLDQGFGWQAVFLINLPLLLVSITLTLLTIPPDRLEGASARIDGTGAVLFASALALLTIGITEGGSAGFADPAVVGLLAGALVVFTGFVAHVRRAPNPLVSPELMRTTTFRISTIVGFAMTLSLATILFFEALYFRRVRGFGAIEAGLLFLPMTGLFGALSTQAGRLERRFGHRLSAIAGLSITTAGAVLLAFQTPRVSLAEPLAGLLLIGLGLGISWAHVTSIGLRVVPASKAGQAAGVLFTARWVGGTIGIALLSVVYRVVADSRLDSYLKGLGLRLSRTQHDQVDGVLSGTTAGHSVLIRFPAATRPELLRTLHDAAGSGTSWALAGVALAVGGGALLALRFPREPAVS